MGINVGFSRSRYRHRRHKAQPPIEQIASRREPGPLLRLKGHGTL